MSSSLCTFATDCNRLQQIATDWVTNMLLFVYLLLYFSKRYTIQGTSMEDRKSWLEVMEGKEPVYSSLKVLEGLYVW